MLAMQTATSARSLLRTATRSDHEEVDALYSLFDLTDRADYTAFLQAQAEAFSPIEAAIGRSQPEVVVDDWPERRRSHLLEADLAELGASHRGETEFPDFTTPEALLGAVYVLEGSRLGGSLLARQLPPAFPRRFLTAGEPKLWRRLIETLDKLLKTEAQIAAAIASARTVFARFETGARRHIKDARIV